MRECGEPAGSVRREGLPFVLGVDVGAVLQQELDDADAVVAGRQVQRSGLGREGAGVKALTAALGKPCLRERRTRAQARLRSEGVATACVRGRWRGGCKMTTLGRSSSEFADGVNFLYESESELLGACLCWGRSYTRTNASLSSVGKSHDLR